MDAVILFAATKNLSHATKRGKEKSIAAFKTIVCAWKLDPFIRLRFKCKLLISCWNLTNWEIRQNTSCCHEPSCVLHLSCCSF